MRRLLEIDTIRHWRKRWDGNKQLSCPFLELLLQPVPQHGRRAVRLVQSFGEPSPGSVFSGTSSCQLFRKLFSTIRCCLVLVSIGRSNQMIFAGYGIVIVIVMILTPVSQPKITRKTNRSKKNHPMMTTPLTRIRGTNLRNHRVKRLSSVSSDWHFRTVSIVLPRPNPFWRLAREPPFTSSAPTRLPVRLRKPL